MQNRMCRVGSFPGNPEYMEGSFWKIRCNVQINSGIDQARKMETINAITNIHISIPRSKVNAHIKTRHKTYYDDTPAKRSRRASERKGEGGMFLMLGVSGYSHASDCLPIMVKREKY
jgi:hypothetical protein